LRKTSAPVFTITATYKNALYVDWHHTVEDVLITGSNDKLIKIWNIKDAASNATSHTNN
jgi:WD40 repeat protein